MNWRSEIGHTYIVDLHSLCLHAASWYAVQCSPSPRQILYQNPFHWRNIPKGRRWLEVLKHGVVNRIVKMRAKKTCSSFVRYCRLRKCSVSRSWLHERFLHMSRALLFSYIFCLAIFICIPMSTGCEQNAARLCLWLYANVQAPLVSCFLSMWLRRTRRPFFNTC